tara:strand:- start:883 stop:1332 length:450 start_codon:yes stop_codon:yes gene_type:complete
MATVAVKNPVQLTQITIAASHAVASLWLMPRITEYLQAYPDTDIRLLVTNNVLEVDATDVDCSIGFSTNKPMAYRVDRLFSQRGFVVSSPEFLAQHKGLSPSQLLATRQLVPDNPTSGWFNWKDWFKGTGMLPVVPLHKAIFSHYNMLI